MKTANKVAANVMRSIKYATEGLNCVAMIPAMAGLTIAPTLYRIEFSAITADISSGGITFWINDSKAGRWMAAKPACAATERNKIQTRGSGNNELTRRIAVTAV